MQSQLSETSLLIQHQPTTANGGRSSLFSSIRRLQKSDGFLLFTISLCTLTDNLIYGIVLPILPSSLQNRAHVPREQLQMWIWITLLSFGVAQFLCIALAALAVVHLSSPTWILFGSLIGLAGAILSYSIANSPWLIILARAAQGASNAVINAVCLMILVDHLGPENYGKSFGYIGMSTAMGCVLGPVLGGVLYDLLGYEAMFLVTAALVSFCALLVLLTSDPNAYATEQSASHHSGSTSISPITDHGSDESNSLMNCKKSDVSQVSQFFLGILGLGLSSLLPASIDTILPLHTQTLFHWSSLQTGLLFLAFVPGSLFGPYFGALASSAGAKPLLVLACTAAAITMALLSFARHNESMDMVLVVFACLIGGLSEPALFSVCGSCIANIVETRMQARGTRTHSAKARVMWASAIVNYGATAGAVIGPFAAGNLCDWLGWTGATVVLSASFGLCGIIFWIKM